MCQQSRAITALQCRHTILLVTSGVGGDAACAVADFIALDGGVLGRSMSTVEYARPILLFNGFAG